jgi:hypothetical protein
MPIRFRCAHCNQLLGIAQSRTGAQVDCPGCGRTVRVPGSDGQSSAPLDTRRGRDVELTDALHQLSALGSDTADEPATSQHSVVLPARQHESTVQPHPLQNPKSTSDSPDLKPAPLQEDSNDQRDDKILDAVAVHDEDWQESLGRMSDGTVSTTVQPVPNTQNAGFSRTHVVAAALLIGVVVGLGISQMFGTTLVPGSTSKPDGDEEKPEDSEPVGEPVADIVGIVKGSVTWTEAGRDPSGDQGALVFLLPVKRSGRWKLDGKPIRSDIDSPDHQAVMAALKELGVSTQLTDPAGTFELDRLMTGPATLVVISRHVTQNDDTLNARAIDELSKWFQNPAQLVGRLAAKTVACPDKSDVPGPPTEIAVKFP